MLVAANKRPLRLSMPPLSIVAAAGAHVAHRAMRTAPERYPATADDIARGDAIALDHVPASHIANTDIADLVAAAKVDPTIIVAVARLGDGDLAIARRQRPPRRRARLRRSAVRAGAATRLGVGSGLTGAHVGCWRAAHPIHRTRPARRRDTAPPGTSPTPLRIGSPAPVSSP